MNKKIKKYFLLFVFFHLSTITLNAHDLGVVRMQLIEKDSFNYTILVKLPIETEIEKAHLKLPLDFYFTEKPFTQIKGAYSLTYYKFKGPRFLTQSDILILPWILDGAFIESNWLDGTTKTVLIKEGKNGIPIDIAELKNQNRSRLNLIKDYVVLGIEHILLGWDHLAFVLALCLISLNTKKLIKLITAFTIGHSITLALAILGIVNIAVPPVEACIAISIALVANEVFNNSVKTKNNMTLVVVAFGLLHGLGFASVLSEIGINKSELFLGLISFNVGVEVGQVLFVLLAFNLLQFASNKLPEYSIRISKSIAFTLGVISFFWFFERLESFYY